MYINKIDELLDKILDDFYKFLNKDSKFSKIKKEDNFVRYQSDINSILKAYIKTINKKDIRTIVKNEDNVDRIYELLKRYIGYYTFITIGYFYEARKDTFNNNIVEFSKNQGEYGLKISSFFNSESNSNIVYFFNMIKQIQTILELEPSKLKIIKAQPKYSDTLKFLNSMGKDKVNSIFTLKSAGGNKKLQAHNTVKTILILELYIKQEKKDIHNILESVEKEEGEYTFIDIVIPKTVRVDYNEVENILSEDEKRQGMASFIYKMLIDNEDKVIEDKETIEWKILQLINKGIIIPVVDDFLLYHKDVEKYDKKQDNKKVEKESTRIKYIVNKIDNITTYYSDIVQSDKIKRKKIENNFYTPLSDRKAVLINENEEVNIITKIEKAGPKAIEKNEYYNDLLAYRRYPYINFQNFEKYGFSIKLNKTIELIRKVSFDLLKNNKRGYNYNPQMRIGSNDMMINIVGFVVNSSKIIDCVKVGDIKNVRGIKKKIESGDKTKIKNGHDGTLRYIKNVKFGNKDLSPIYWEFDISKDTISKETYEMTSNINSEEVCKLLVASVYDNILDYANGHILRVFDKFDDLDIYKAHMIMEYYNDTLFDIPKGTDNYADLEKVIFREKYVKGDDKYDTNEDTFPGLDGKVIKLPIIKKKKDSDIKKITVSYKEDDVEEDRVNIGNAICQHFVSWDNISATRKKNPNKYTTELTEFMHRYVIENREGDYICKSCGTQLSIKNYVAGGVYDKDSGSFTTFSTPIETPIENIYEYRKLKTTIRNIDKLVERVASVANIVYYIGNTMNVRSRRNKIVKDVIDLVTIHNKNMEDTYKKRKENIKELYGIDKNASNMFIFPLEDSIYAYSSKEKDYYKLVKQNNILSYIIFLMMIELNKSQIMYLTGTKTCNYYFYKKFGKGMFDNLKIITNDSNNIENANNYDIFCYLLYYISCLGVRYQLWNYIGDEELQKKTFSPIIQKVIVQTIIDIVNSIIEVNNKNNDKSESNHLYGLTVGRFFNKLQTLFNDESLSDILERNVSKKFVKIEGKTKFIKTKTNGIELVGHYKPMNFGYRKMVVRTGPTFYPKLSSTQRLEIKDISNITNCPNGAFHKWKFKNGNLVCSICDVKMDDIKLNEKTSNEIRDNYINMKLQESANKYCQRGMMHLFSDSLNKKCSSIDNKQFNKKELQEFSNAIISYRTTESIKLHKKYKKQYLKYQEENEFYDDIINSMKTSYNKTVKSSADRLKFIDSLIYNIQNVVGDNIFIPKVNRKIYINEDVYSINHDRYGNTLSEPIILKPNKVLFQNNNKFFNTDVLYYTDYKTGRTNVYYDALNKHLLGYKEENKDYTINKDVNRYIRIKYSLKSQLLLMGYSSKYIDISNKLDELKNIYKDDETQIKNNIASTLNRERIVNLKKLLFELQRNIYRINYNYRENYKPTDMETYIEPYIDKYRKSLKNIKLDDKGNNRIFKSYEKISTYITYKSPKKDINLDINSKYISAESLTMLDYQGNLLLYYIVNELKRLIYYNKNRFVKTNVIQMIVETITNVFDSINMEYWNSKLSIKRFKYILEYSIQDYDIQENYDLEGVYGEYVDKDDEVSRETLEERYDNIEEAEALDVDMDSENETDMLYDSDYNLSRSYSMTEGDYQNLQAMISAF